MLYLHLAWRNIWRNKRRTLISIGSVLFAVLFALLTRSMQLGSYSYMIRNVVRLSTGYMQIHAAGFWDKRSIDLAFSESDDLRTRIAAIPHVTELIPRLQTFALAASTSGTRGAMVNGIDPGAEDAMNGLASKVIRGSYLTPRNSGAMIGEALASTLGLDVGDTLILYGQGYHGLTAAGMFPVGGIVRYPNPEMNASLVYLALPAAQRLFAMPGMVNSLSVMLDAPRHQQEALARLRALVGEEYEVMAWQEMMPEVVQGIEVDNAGGIIMIAILYVIIGFGIFGTVMMMTLERRREFGVLIAVGMKRSRLAMVTGIESLILSLLGVLAGTVLAAPVLVALYYNPIRLSGEAAEVMLEFGFDPLLPFSVDPTIFISQTLAVLIIALISSCYPVLVLRRLDPVAAMRA
jgi:ABC-type lipoprotein release transport system permease subunit